MGSVNTAVYARGASSELILSIRIYVRELEITKLPSLIYITRTVAGQGWGQERAQ